MEQRHYQQQHKQEVDYVAVGDSLFKDEASRSDYTAPNDRII
jgi:hypothetical protein